jgi:lipoprotein-releasing system ATP-binding protein
MLKARDIHKAYDNLLVLKGVDVDIQEGEIVSIVGSSGAGKSTLLHILGTLDRPDTGTIELNHTRLDLLRGNKLAAYRNANMGFVFQFHHLLPEFTAVENVCIPGWIAGTGRKQNAQRGCCNPWDLEDDWRISRMPFPEANSKELP